MSTGGNVEVTALPATGTANYVRALDGNFIPVNSATSDPAAMSAAFLAEYGGVFGVRNPATELSLLQVDTDTFGLTTTRYQQIYQGIPVYGAALFVHFNRAGQVMSANGRTVVYPSEGLWDGGIIEYSVNGGPYAQLPAGRLT